MAGSDVQEGGIQTLAPDCIRIFLRVKARCTSIFISMNVFRISFFLATKLVLGVSPTSAYYNAARIFCLKEFDCLDVLCILTFFLMDILDEMC